VVCRNGEIMSIQIITDSGADYTAEELKRRNIQCVPMSVSFGEENFVDGVTLTKEMFYEKLMSSKETPKTAQPSPVDFLDKFEAAKKAKDTVIAILISSALSGTYQTAVMAKTMSEYDDIYIVDSRSATLGMRLLVDIAVNMRDQGESAENIVAQLDSLKKKIRLYAGLDTLEYLYKGGRISKGVASIGALANIKPLVTFTSEGSVSLCGKQVGIRHAIKQVAKLVEADKPDEKYPVYYLYSYDRSNTAGFIRALEKNGFVVENPKIREIGPTIGSHIGPNAFGIVYISHEEIE
jgi:DegV family protein with EDD domain